jgi:hypothetical protein
MTTHKDGRLRACRDRCEVCDVVLTTRPVPSRRRCADHLDQLVLLPLSSIITKTTTRRGRDGR